MEEKVYKLKKALYGLKQAPHAWYAKSDNYFVEHGYCRSQNEPTLYVKHVNEQEVMYVCLYGNDIICTSSSEFLIEDFKNGMKHSFEMTDMGPLKYFLGLEVNQTNQGIFVSQEAYATNLLNKYGMMNCKMDVTPMNTNEKLQSEGGSGKVDAEMFRSMVGGLIYLTHTRPDLAYSVSVVSRFMQCPSKLHLGAVKRILQYVTGKINYGLWYAQGKVVKLIGYSDSDWGSFVDDRKSMSANVFSVGSAVISWCAKKQHTVALSGTEAEYIAATGATCQGVWLRRVLEDLGQKQKDATVILCDNKSTINLSKNPIMHSCSKHIELKYHFIGDMVNQEQIALEYCNTQSQLADVLTKSLTKEKFEFFKKQLGVMKFGSRRAIEE